MKTKENQVRDLLLKNDIDFIQDKVLQNECCLKYRPDFTIDCGSYFIIIECDENAHSHYDKECEVIRMNNISSIVGLPIKWIRYNPDNKSVSKAQKEYALIQLIKSNMNKNFLHNLEVEYLFY